AIGKSTLNDVIMPSGVHDNFYVLPSGPIPPNPAELLLLPKTNELFEILKEQFDYVLIDTPPIGLVTDAQLLSKYANMSLYVVRHAYTFKQQIQIVDELYRNEKIQKLSLIINDIPVQQGYGYGYRYG